MKLKILYIISDRQFGGGSRHVCDLVENLDPEKFETVLISRPSPILDKLKNKVKTYSVPMANRWDRQSIKTARQIIAKEKPNIIHLHSTRAGILGTLAAKNLNIPVVYTEHLFTKDYLPHNWLIHTCQLWAFKKLSRYVTKVIAVSQAVRDYLVNKAIFPAEKVQIIYHGIRSKSKIINLKSKIKKIGSVGSLNYQKGFQYLIPAMQKIDNIELEIVGVGGDLAKLRQLDYNKKTRFLGFVEDLVKVMGEWDIYVQPSLGEAFGLALAEAMAMGLPVVATRTGAIPELVQDGVNGILVDRKNSDELTNAITKLQNDFALRRRMSENNIKRIKDEFNLDKMVKETEKLYEQTSQLRA